MRKTIGKWFRFAKCHAIGQDSWRLAAKSASLKDTRILDPLHLGLTTNIRLSPISVAMMQPMISDGDAPTGIQPAGPRKKFALSRTKESSDEPVRDFRCKSVPGTVTVVGFRDKPYVADHRSKSRMY
jgi:hypothetical protein